MRKSALNSIVPIITGEEVYWTPGPTDPDEVGDALAYLERWCSLFSRHDFFMGGFTGAGFRARSIERLATHPIWIARLTRGTAVLSDGVRAARRELRALLKAQGIRLDRDCPSVRIQRDSIVASWIGEDGQPGRVSWNRRGIREEVRYENEPAAIRSLSGDELKPAEVPHGANCFPTCPHFGRQPFPGWIDWQVVIFWFSTGLLWANAR